MEYSQLVRDILKNPNFSINTVCPSYVKRFLPELEDGPFLIFHKTVSYTILFTIYILFDLL